MNSNNAADSHQLSSFLGVSFGFGFGISFSFDLDLGFCAATGSGFDGFSAFTSSLPSTRALHASNSFYDTLNAGFFGNVPRLTGYFRLKN